jgi:glucose/arabinose dehydrogenase
VVCSTWPVTRRLPRPCLALAAVATTLAVVACGSDRAGGAGDLTVTSRAAHAAKTPPPPTPAQSTRTALAASHAGATHVRFARVALRGTDHTVIVPRGWHAELWARVDDARLEAWSPQGTLLVSSPDDGTVTELTPHHGAPTSTRTILSGLTNPQGLAFDHLDGREYLYVADSDAVYCYRWSTVGTATHRTTTVTDLPDTQPTGDDVHRLKNVVVAPDHTVYVDIGSSSNATVPAAVTRGTLPRASIIAVHFSPYFTYLKPVRARVSVYATGVRNGDGLAIAPDGSLWTAVNERDQTPYPFHRHYEGDTDAYGQVISAYVDNHPPDEVDRLTPGRNLGWPYCDPDPDTTPGAATSAFDYTNMPFTDDEATNPHGDRLDCAKLTPIQRGLPAHSAPLGMSFLNGSRLPGRWADGAVVAAHGSWDREPPRPPVVYWMPWDARAHTLGPAIVLVSGFQEANGSRWGRLADAVAGPDGSLYVTDDQSGAVYRITP